MGRLDYEAPLYPREVAKSASEYNAMLRRYKARMRELRKAYASEWAERREREDAILQARTAKWRMSRARKKALRFSVRADRMEQHRVRQQRLRTAREVRRDMSRRRKSLWLLDVDRERQLWLDELEADAQEWVLEDEIDERISPALFEETRVPWQYQEWFELQARAQSKREEELRRVASARTRQARRGGGSAAAEEAEDGLLGSDMPTDTMDGAAGEMNMSDWEQDLDGEVSDASLAAALAGGRTAEKVDEQELVELEDDIEPAELIHGLDRADLRRQRQLRLREYAAKFLVGRRGDGASPSSLGAAAEAEALEEGVLQPEAFSVIPPSVVEEEGVANLAKSTFYEARTRMEDVGAEEQARYFGSPRRMALYAEQLMLSRLFQEVTETPLDHDAFPELFEDLTERFPLLIEEQDVLKAINADRGDLPAPGPARDREVAEREGVARQELARLQEMHTQLLARMVAYFGEVMYDVVEEAEEAAGSIADILLPHDVLDASRRGAVSRRAAFELTAQRLGISNDDGDASAAAVVVDEEELQQQREGDFDDEEAGGVGSSSSRGVLVVGRRDEAEPFIDLEASPEAAAVLDQVRRELVQQDLTPPRAADGTDVLITRRFFRLLDALQLAVEGSGQTRATKPGSRAEASLAGSGDEPPRRPIPSRRSRASDEIVGMQAGVAKESFSNLHAAFGARLARLQLPDPFRTLPFSWGASQLRRTDEALDRAGITVSSYAERAPQEPRPLHQAWVGSPSSGPEVLAGTVDIQDGLPWEVDATADPAAADEVVAAREDRRTLSAEEKASLAERFRQAQLQEALRARDHKRLGYLAFAGESDALPPRPPPNALGSDDYDDDVGESGSAAVAERQRLRALERLARARQVEAAVARERPFDVSATPTVPGPDGRLQPVASQLPLLVDDALDLTEEANIQQAFQESDVDRLRSLLQRRQKRIEREAPEVWQRYDLDAPYRHLLDDAHGISAAARARHSITASVTAAAEEAEFALFSDGEDDEDGDAGAEDDREA